VRPIKHSAHGSADGVLVSSGQAFGNHAGRPTGVFGDRRVV
jgi:hypothetical protein